MTLTVGSLFSGIGGLDLGLERAGMTVKWQSEIDPYASRVLAKHWPTVPNLGDIKAIDWKQVPRVDLICGGYPCQPFSYAGKRGGDTDPRHLWPRFADGLRHLRPRFALLENVPGHLSMGFGDVLGDLADLGYDTEWDCIPAAAVGAPHLRYRIFVVACRTEQRRAVADASGGWGQDDGLRAGRHEFGFGGQDVADTQCIAGDFRRTELLRGRKDEAEQAGLGGSEVADPDDAGRGEQRGTVTVRAQLAAVERAGWWSVEPDVGRVAHGVPRRVDRLRTLGNAVVPQVAEWVGRRIMEAA